MQPFANRASKSTSKQDAAKTSSPKAPPPKTLPARLYHVLMTISGMLAALLFGLMAMLVCLDVLLRNVSTVSISWAVEMTEYMLMTAAFLAAPWLAYGNDHICVDVLVRGLPAALKKRVAWACNAVCFFICVVLAWESASSLLANAAQGGMIFKVLIFPEWWLAIPITFSFTLLSVEFMRRLCGGGNPQGDEEAGGEHANPAGAA